MFNDSNVVQLRGVVSQRDAVEHSLKGDGSIIEFTLGVPRSGRGGDTSKGEFGFFTVKMFLIENDYAAASDVRLVKEMLGDGRLAKGARVGLIGSLILEKWNDKEGNPQSRVVINADKIFSMQPRATAGSSAGSTSAPAASAAAGESFVPEEF